MSSYHKFAQVYDRLIGQDYEKWADYIQALFERYGAKPKLVLDLGCGTGSLTAALARRGYDMLGIDRSCDMLSMAMEKGQGLDIRWLCQDVRKFELYGTVDAVICTMDVLNYLTDPAELKQVFALVKNYLNPGGLFLFDINTPYKLRHVLGDNVFLYDDEDVFYGWDNEFNPKTGISTQNLTFFTREQDVYRRFDEEHIQRAHTEEEIACALEFCGLSLLDTFGCFTFAPPPPDCEKQLFAAKDLG